MVVKHGEIFILRDYVLVLSRVYYIEVCDDIHHTFSELPHTTKIEILKSLNNKIFSTIEIVSAPLKPTSQLAFGLISDDPTLQCLE